MKPVTIYSTPTCHFCHMAKDYFTANNIEFTDHDVAADQEKRSDMIDMTGQMGVPVIVIGEGEDKEVIIGFNEEKVAELLGVGDTPVIDMTSKPASEGEDVKMAA